MRLHLVFIGKTAFPDLETGINRYLDRLRCYLPTQIHVLKAEKIPPRGAEEPIKEREAERVLRLVEKRDCLVIWDQQGKDNDSVAFASFLDGIRNRGVTALWMVIGGPLGVSQKLLARADFVLSLSRMTFPHDLARLMVMEQLYRAFTILKGEAYHK
jgi:23S rRNA (pseudouridine1915-N3)-methyltransferase